MNSPIIAQNTDEAQESISINGGVGRCGPWVVEGKGWGWQLTPVAEYVAPAPKPSRAELQSRWEAAKQFLDTMHAAYERGEISFEAMNAADLAEDAAYTALWAAKAGR